MTGRRSIRFGLVAVLGVFLASCGSNEADLQNFAREKKLSKPQTAAFMACAKGHKNAKPILVNKDGNMLMKRTPMEICACQAKTITSVFVEEDFKSYATFADYMAKEVKKKPPYISKKVLKSDLKGPDATKRLEKSLSTCVNTYLAANQDLEEPLLELLPVKETEKKDEKPKTAS